VTTTTVKVSGDEAEQALGDLWDALEADPDLAEHLDEVHSHGGDVFDMDAGSVVGIIMILTPAAVRIITAWLKNQPRTHVHITLPDGTELKVEADGRRTNLTKVIAALQGFANRAAHAECPPQVRSEEGQQE
jgi:hypothetical protein